MTRAYEHVRVETVDAVQRVNLARPDVHNAFGPTMIAELTSVFEEAAGDAAVRVAVLAGDGPSFSAGADLEYMRSMADFDREDNIADARRMAGLFASIRDCPKPVVARVHGAAMGGGVGLVAACDIAVAASGTRFAFSESRIGVVPAVISPFVVPRIGLAAARELFLTGERFDAERAQAIGLVARVVPLAELDSAIDERLAALMAAAPEAQAEVKRLVSVVGGVSSVGSDVSAGIADDSAGDSAGLTDFTAQLIADRRASAEGREGISAFLERRKPSWQEPESEGAAT